MSLPFHKSIISFTKFSKKGVTKDWPHKLINFIVLMKTDFEDESYDF